MIIELSSLFFYSDRKLVNLEPPSVYISQGSGGDCDPRQKYQVWFFAFSDVSYPRRKFGTNFRPVTRRSPIIKILKNF